MEQLDRGMKKADSFYELSFAVQYQTEECPWWQYYSAFTPNPEATMRLYERLQQNKHCTAARIVQREDVRKEIPWEELAQAKPCSRSVCRSTPFPNEDGRIIGRNK